MNRRILYVLTAVLLIIAAVVVVYFTPLFSVKNFEVRGQEVTSTEEIIEASKLREGDNLASIDARRAANDVATLPWIAKATVVRSWPDTVAIEVHERQAVMYVKRKDGEHLVDRTGTAFLIDTPPPGSIEIRGTKEDDAELFGKLGEIIESLSDLPEEIVAFEVPDPYSVTLVFDDGRTVEWGAPENNHDKAVATRIVLQREGQHWNVSDPIQVTVK